jgi:hypothetical protein
VRQAVGFFLLRSDLSHLDSVVLESGTTPDGRHSQVVLSSLWRPPVVSEFLPASLQIGVQARSQVFIQQAPSNRVNLKFLRRHWRLAVCREKYC